jgi:hypothetical protein
LYTPFAMTTDNNFTPGLTKSAGIDLQLSPTDEQPKALASTFAKATSTKADSKDEQWQDYDVIHQFGGVEVQEEDGSWRPVEMSRHKQNKSIILHFGGVEVEGMDGDYALSSSGVLTAGGEKIEFRKKICSVSAGDKRKRDVDDKRSREQRQNDDSDGDAGDDGEWSGDDGVVASESPKRKAKGKGKAAKRAGVSALTKEAKEAFASIEKPVTEESFVKWYCGSHEVRGAQAASVSSSASKSSAPASKGQMLAAKPPALDAKKRKALLKGVATSLKAASKAKRWHQGDSQTLAGETICDPAEFAALFPGVPLSTKGGALTTLALNENQLSSAFGALIEKIKVPTWSRGHRAFAKSYKTGSVELSIESAEGKYSKGTSKLTLKFQARAGGGYGGHGSGYGSCFFGGMSDY